MNKLTKIFLPIVIIILLQQKSFSQINIQHKSPENFSPDKSLNLKLAAPVTSWDEAIPLGNGITGGLVWGEKNVLRLSLDRGDIWDERVDSAIDKYWWKKYNYPKAVGEITHGKSVNKWWDPPYDNTTPTKLPVGRLELFFSKKDSIESFELDLASAQSHVKLNNGEINTFYHANEKYCLIQIKDLNSFAVHLLTTSDVYKANSLKDNQTAVSQPDAGSYGKLGYPVAQKGNTKNCVWFVQQTFNGFKYVVCVQKKIVSSNEVLIAVAITTTDDAKDALALAKKRCNDALQHSYNDDIATHKQWWKNFWRKSAISIPDSPFLKQYYFVQYLYGAGSHAHTPPMPLQGVWTCDNGNLPPWKGDYHSDLNTQMTYIAYQTAGRLDEGSSYLNFLFNRRKLFQQFAKDFYHTAGLNIPGVMTYAGQPLGGWGMYALSPTMGAWNAHLFYLHWRYSMSNQFLADTAYSFCSGIGTSVLQLLKKNDNGNLVLPLSSSPEIFDNSMQSWLVPNSNYDVACTKMLFLSLKEMATALHKNAEANKWANIANKLDDFHTKNDTLMIDAKTILPYSHRHLSNLMGIYPFNLITIESNEKDKRIIQSSLKNWDDKGTSNWCGYTFSWMSCLYSRVGDAEGALKYIHAYLDGFILRNGFHCNGDQSGKNYSSFKYRPFTLEGNFLASQALQEMLLQSWSPTPGEINTSIIRIFPSVPKEWKDASFSDLLTECGHKVSAIRKNCKTVWFKIIVGSDGVVRIKNNFFDQKIEWKNNSKCTYNNDIIIFNSKKGDVIEAVLKTNDQIVY